MEINVLDILKKQLNADLIQKAASFFGEENSTTQKAVSAILPSVLGGFANQATNSSDATQLLNSINTGNHDGSVLDVLGTLLSGGSVTQGFIDSGENTVSQLFGSKLGGIIDWIAAYAGIKAGSVSGLLNMAAPIVLGAIGKQVAASNTSASGLMGLLASQIPFIKNALPSGLASVLGLANVDLSTPSVASTVQASKNESENRNAYVERKTSGLEAILPWVLLAAVGIGGILYLKMCNTIKAPEPPQAVAVVDSLTTPPADTVKKLVLPEGNIEVKTGSFLDQLYTEATDSTLDATKALTFDNVNFATGSAQITEESKVQLDDLAKIMKAYPKVEIKIEGHTDNSGNEVANKKLSQDRAAAVKSYLVSHGIVATRIVTAGFGSTKPIGDNATEEGKAKNRRIEAFIVKK